MRGKLFLLGLMGLIGLYLSNLSDPINALTSFIIGGTIPGTGIVLGWWPMVTLAFFCLILIYRAVRKLQLKALEQTSLMIVAEKRAEKFKHQNSGVSSKNKSVIAAPTSTNTI